jgi:hypothetical protein
MKQRWQENREMMQMKFDELDEEYDKLKKLVELLGKTACQTAEDVLKAGGVGIARPDRLRKLMRESKKALGD